MTENNIEKPKWYGRLARATAWIIGIGAAIVLILEAVMSTSMVTGTVNRIASRYIDGDISFGKVSVSLLKRFPSVTATLEDFCITYPADRFDAEELAGPQGDLLYKGNGTTADTLASFSRFSASVRVVPLLFGKLAVPAVSLHSPKIYAHSYADGKANWDIFRLGEEPQEQEDTTAATLPDISLGKIDLTDDSYIVYTDSRDTIFALIELKKAGFHGRLATRNSARNRIGLAVDSMFVAGRVAADTLALGLDRLRIHEHDDHIDVDMSAKSIVASSMFGRMSIPIDMSGTLHFPKDTVFAVGVHNFKAEIAAIPFEGEADIRLHEDRANIDGRLSVTECSIDDIITKFVRNFIPEASKIKTDAIVGIDASCKGDYVFATGKLPVFSIDMIMPRSTIRHTGMGEEVVMALDAYIANTRQGKLNINVNEVALSTEGLSLEGFGGMTDILSDDPSISVDGNIRASLDTLTRFLPDTLNIKAEGNISGEISGSARLSDLSLYTFSRSSLTGSLESDNITVKMPDDSINVEIAGLTMALKPENVTSRRDSTQSFRLMGITGGIEKIDAAYKGGLALKGESITLTAKNSATSADTSQVQRLGGRFGAVSLTLTDASGTNLDLDETQNGFQMMPDRDNPKVPVLTLTSSNKRITLATDVNRAILTDASLDASATMRTLERRPRTRTTRDSLARRSARELPEWMQEEDFRSKDIDIRLDQSLARYFREWDMHGDLKVRTGIIMTPYFPLRNILRGMEICFTNDRIAIDSMKVMAGKSEIEAKGELTGLRRALTGRGGRTSRSVLKLDLDISTDGMNANEVLAAYNAGSNFNPESAKDKMADASNSDFLQMVIADTASAEEKAQLLVLPGNVNADIQVNGKNIIYSDLEISDLNANLLMKERCVQISNTMATSNIGNVSFEGFYATRSKKDIKAGFNFDFKDITAEKALDLMPAVDTLMPLLKSFAGKLNCELAATASLDTNMNILTPTINGILRITGDDLTVSDSDMFTSLAKKLKFSDRQTGRINHMTVEGVIKDNVIEVFPFVLSLDRYTLALSGKQNLDMSYRYHASIIRSPLVIKVGVDVFGEDFDNMKFRICRPKYRNENVPVFTAVIDETKINLAQSIKNIFDKGVEAAVRDNERQEAIIEHRQEIGYVNAVDQETEELSAEEQRELEEAVAEPQQTETSETTTENIQDNE